MKRPTIKKRLTPVDRSQLKTVVAGLAEGILLIEPDQRIVWANAAALAMHGVQEAWDIGATVADYRRNFILRYRNNHALDDDQYPIERVIAGEVLDDITVEVRPARDPSIRWVHRIRSMVLTDADQQPDCLVLVIVDATERFAAEERFERTFAANPAPALICRLSDLRFLKVNQGFVDMTGYSRDFLLGRSTYEIDLLSGVTDRALAIERLSEGRVIPQMEADLPLPDGGTRFVILAGQPMEMDHEPCMLFTFADLDMRRRAETALKASEERFVKSFQLSPVPTILVRLDDLICLAINEAFMATFGVRDEQILETPGSDFDIWCDGALRDKFRKDVSASEHVRNFDARLIGAGSTELDCLISAEKIVINGQECILSVILDVTERKRSERELMEAINAVMADASWFSQGVIEKLAAFRNPQRASEETVDLSAREREVLGLICQGSSDTAISERLSVSRHTVRNHVAALYRKLGLHRRSEVVIWGRERGF